MKICLLDSAASELLTGDAATYVGQLGPALAEEHRIRIVSVKPGIARALPTAVKLRRVLAADHPEIVHINNLSGLPLAAVLYAVASVTLSPAVAIGLHDDLLLRRLLELNRALTRSIGLVVSPSLSLLDRHRAAGFFPNAMHEVIPYAMPYHAARVVAAYRGLLIRRRSGDLGNQVA